MRALLALSGGCRRRFRASGALRALYSKFVWRGRKGQNARLEHFFSGLPCVASACSVFGIAAGSPPSLYDGDLLRPHRAPYYLRACSLGNLTEKCSKTWMCPPFFISSVWP